MLRVIIGGILAAIVVFVANMASWMIPGGWHDGTLEPLPAKWSVIAEPAGSEIPGGVYVAPFPESAPDETPQACWENFAKAHRQGPLVTLFYHRTGMEPMGPKTLAQGFLIDLVAAWIAAIILHLGRLGLFQYWQRVLVVALLGVFTALTAHGGYYVWMNFAAGHSLAMAADSVACWLLAGLVLGAIVKEIPTDVTDRRPILHPPGVEP